MRLKSLIIRSNEQGQTIAALFIKDRLSFSDYPKLSGNWLGFKVYYSTHKSPASTPDEPLYSDGQDFLIEEINSVKFEFGLLSFFQVNVPIFKKTLMDIANFLDDNNLVADYYSGVGSISLSLAEKFKDCVLLDSNEEAIGYARENIRLNNLDNCRAISSPAEKMTELVHGREIIIFDPPRVGLHDKVVKTILEQLPKKLVYLSCNPESQARDIALLSCKYRVIFLKLYNFFPRTTHIEALGVLELR